jgi:hypothetical protein
LIDGWSNPAIRFAGHNDLGDFVGCEVAQSELLEFALLVELVYGSKSLVKLLDVSPMKPV